MTEDPIKEGKISAPSPLRKSLIVGLIVTVALIFTVTIWPTRYRYETMHRCLFKYDSPYTNPDWQRRVAGAKQFQRYVSSTIKNESYRVDRISGEIFIPGQEGWQAIGQKYDKPWEFLESSPYGTWGQTSNGCREHYAVFEQSDTPTGPWEEIKETKPDSNGKPSPSPTK